MFLSCLLRQERHILDRFCFGFYRCQISKRSTSCYRTFRALVAYSFVLLNRFSAHTINIKTSKKSCLTSCQHHELHCLADVIFYQRVTVFQCYLSAIMHELNNSLCNWFPPLQKHDFQTQEVLHHQTYMKDKAFYRSTNN